MDPDEVMLRHDDVLVVFTDTSSSIAIFVFRFAVAAILFEQRASITLGF
jgi:hypothetical protein